MRLIGEQVIAFPKEVDGNKQYEMKISKFIEDLMKNQGFYVKAPIQLFYRAMPDADAINEAAIVWKGTKDMLAMMGIPFISNETNFSIMIEEINET